MRKLWIKPLMMACLVGLPLMPAGAANDDSDKTGRSLNPYHEQQLQDQIRKCASGVLACTDAEQRSIKQQELCQLLIRSERYDEALQVANNIYKLDTTNKERQAAHHYLMAEIYNRKMQGATSVSEMEQNRQHALSLAQEVVDRKYPSQWGVSEHARGLIRNLEDSKSMASVKRRVEGRQGNKGDSAKEALADAQRNYLDKTQGGGRRDYTGAATGAQYRRVPANDQIVSARESNSSLPSLSEGGNSARAAVPNERPEVSRVFTPIKANASSMGQTNSNFQPAGTQTNQPAAIKSVTERGPLTVNGQVANNLSTADEIAKNNLAQLMEAAKRRRENERRSPYATGEGPSSSR